MITSFGNPKVRQVTALIKRSRARREQGLFVTEGIRMFLETPAQELESVFVSESFWNHRDHKAAVEKKLTEAMKAGIRGNFSQGSHILAEAEVVSDAVFQSMSDTRTPQGILALVRQRQWNLEDMLKSETHPPLLIILEGLQDPGNLGTILRAGEGAGVSGVIMDRQTADIYNPKVIRSTMGSVYRVPFMYVDQLEETLDELKQKGIILYAAHLEGSSYDKKTYSGPSGFLIGNEAAGLKDETASQAQFRVSIPMLGQLESLNAAVAASVLMYEAARQRRLN